jgi:hypothetical protein
MEYFGMFLGGVPESGERFEDNGRSHFVTVGFESGLSLLKYIVHLF